MLAKSRVAADASALLERGASTSSVTRIDGLAAHPNEQPDLSQRLAEHGLLPMFGFPTQVRYLFTRKPLTSHPWPPPGAIDRDLRVAVSEFAPGNEIVVDKFVYRSLGLVGFQPRHGPRAAATSGAARTDDDRRPLRRLQEHRRGARHRLPQLRALPAEGYRNEVELAFPAGFRGEWTRSRTGTSRGSTGCPAPASRG